MDTNVILIASPEVIQKIDELNEKLDLLLESKSSVTKDTSEYLTSEEARKLLNVSRATWQTMRDQRRLPFSQIGRKIYVRKGDVFAYLDNHVINK